VDQAFQEPDDAFPEEINFNDFDGSRRVFSLLEAFTDGWGAWKIQDVLGLPLVEVDERLADDLMKLRWLKGIAERIKSKKDDQSKDGKPDAGD
jgi:hypothetical protein